MSLNKLLYIIAIISKLKQQFIFNNINTKICPLNSYLNIKTNECLYDKAVCLNAIFDADNNILECTNCAEGYYLYNNYCYKANENILIIEPKTLNYVKLGKNFEFVLYFIKDYNNIDKLFDKEKLYNILLELKVFKIMRNNNYSEKIVMTKAIINPESIINYIYSFANNFLFNIENIYEFNFTILTQDLLVVKEYYFYYMYNRLGLDYKLFDNNNEITSDISQIKENNLLLSNLNFIKNELVSIEIKEAYTINGININNILFYNYESLKIMEFDYYVRFVPSLIIKKYKITDINYKLLLVIRGETINFNTEIKFKNIFLITNYYIDNISNYQFNSSIFLMLIYNVLTDKFNIDNFATGVLKYDNYLSNKDIKFNEKLDIKYLDINYSCDINCSNNSICKFNNITGMFYCDCYNKDMYKDKLCALNNNEYKIINNLFDKITSFKDNNTTFNKLLLAKNILILSEYLSNQYYYLYVIELLNNLFKDSNTIIDNFILNNIFEILSKINILREYLKIDNNNFNDLIINFITYLTKNIDNITINNNIYLSLNGLNLLLYNLKYYRYNNKDIDGIVNFKISDVDLKYNYILICYNNYNTIINKKVNILSDYYLYCIQDKDNSTKLDFMSNIKNWKSFINLENKITYKIIDNYYDNKYISNSNYLNNINTDNYNEVYVKAIDLALGTFGFYNLKLIYNYIVAGKNNYNSDYLKLNNNNNGIYYELEFNEKSYFNAESIYYNEVNTDNINYNNYYIYLYINLGLFVLGIAVIVILKYEKLIIFEEKYKYNKNYEEVINRLKEYIYFYSAPILFLFNKYSEKAEKFCRLLLLLLNIQIYSIITFIMYTVINTILSKLEFNMGIISFYIINSLLSVIISQIFITASGLIFGLSINLPKQISKYNLNRFLYNIFIKVVIITLLIILVFMYSIMIEIYYYFSVNKINSNKYMAISLIIIFIDLLILPYAEYLMSIKHSNDYDLKLIELKYYYRGFSIYNFKNFKLFVYKSDDKTKTKTLATQNVIKGKRIKGQLLKKIN